MIIWYSSAENFKLIMIIILNENQINSDSEMFLTVENSEIFLLIWECDYY